MHNSAPQGRKAVSGMERPGVFQCLLLRSLDLPKAERDVFLLKEIKGNNLPEIAAILDISADEVSARWKRARREIDPVGDSDAVGESETIALSNACKPSWPARNRLSDLAGLLRLAPATAADQATLAFWAREKVLALVEAAQRTAPRVMVAASNIFR